MTPAQSAALAALRARASDASLHAIDLQAAVLEMARALDPPPPPPTYTLSAEPPALDEGQSVAYVLRTEHVPAGTALPYRLLGIQPADIAVVSLAGALVIGADGTARLDVLTLADRATEGNETMVCEVDTPSGVISAAALICDTSLAPPPTPTHRLVVTALDPKRTIIPRDWMWNSLTYERWQLPVIVTDSTYLFQWRCCDRTTGREYWPGDAYIVRVDGVPVATVGKPATNVGAVTLRRDDYAHGWHVVDVTGVAGETCIPLPVFIVRDEAAPPPDQMPVVRGSYDAINDIAHAVTAWVPARFDPVTRPVLVSRAYPHFSEPLTRDKLYLTEVVPKRGHDVYRPRVTKGVLNTANQQNYQISPLLLKYPGVALLDGPRGMGSVSGVTHLQVGRQGPTGLSSIYFCEAWRVGKITPDGTVATLAGLRSRSPAARHEPSIAADYELVGDWSAVPLERRGFHEVWGLAWDERTVARGSGAAIPNPPNPDEPPHDANPVAFVADSQNNRIVRLTFDGRSHAAAPKVTEHIVGLSDPWDCVCVAGVLYVSERSANRISAWDASTGAFLRTIVQGEPGFASLMGGRRAVRLKPLDQIRAQKCTLPEGMFHQDGWLYYGALASQDIKRVSLSTGEVQTSLTLSDADASPAGAQYVKFALSDGTFGPRGSFFVQFWTANASPMSMAYLPDGRPWVYFGNGGNGPGMTWEGYEYGSAVAVGNGRMVFGSSIEGLYMIGQAAPGDPQYTWDGGYKAARDEWQARNLHLTHGPGGWGYYGLPLPWGTSPGVDAWLTMNGHRP